MVFPYVSTPHSNPQSLSGPSSHFGPIPLPAHDHYDYFDSTSATTPATSNTWPDLSPRSNPPPPSPIQLNPHTSHSPPDLGPPTHPLPMPCISSPIPDETPLLDLTPLWHSNHPTNPPTKLRDYVYSTVSSTQLSSLLPGPIKGTSYLLANFLSYH